MTDIAEETVAGCAYHEVTVEGPGRFKVEVYRAGFMRWDDETDEPVFFGGEKTATLYRSTEALAIGAGIEYSFVTHRAGEPGTGFRGVRGPKYGRPVPR